MILKIVTKYVIYILLIYALVAGVYLLGFIEFHFDRSGQLGRKRYAYSADIRHEPIPPNYDQHSDEMRDKDTAADTGASPFDQDGGKKKFKELLDHIADQSKLIQELNSKLNTESSSHQDKLRQSQQQQEQLNAQLKEAQMHIQKIQTSGGTGASQPSKTGQTDFFSLYQVEDLPTSSVFCHGTSREDRFCRIKNLCYHPQRDQWFIVKGNRTQLAGVPEASSEALLDMTSLSDHSVFYWKYIEVPEHQFTNTQVRIVNDPTYILMRFHTGNIMHAVHDDLLGLYHMMKVNSAAYPDFFSAESSYSYDKQIPFDKNVNVLFIEGFAQGGYGHVFKHLTDRELRFKADLQSPHMTCFSNAIVGQSKRANWYQYGFATPQGPINKNVSGYDVREVASYVMKDLKLPPWNRMHQKMTLLNLRRTVIAAMKDPSLSFYFTGEKLPVLAEEPDSYDKITPSIKQPEESCIVIFGRRHDRLLKNEEELANILSQIFHLPVKYVRNEDLQFHEQVAVLRTATIAIGMHGSLLIMGMFLPPGSILIELYPYAVPADNYTPYKTMSRLPGMEITYRSWTNTHPENNIPHPEYPGYHGGLNDKAEDLREKIQNTLTVPTHLCCSDPYWLFRIYQDTIAAIPELVTLIAEAIFESNKKFGWRETQIPIVPSPISHVTARRIDAAIPEEPSSIQVNWEIPWNVGPDFVSEYGIWIHQSFTEYRINGTAYTFDGFCKDYPDKDIEIWVRSYYRMPEQDTLKFTEWSKKVVASCDKSKPALGTPT